MIDMHTFVEDGIRGGLSITSKRNTKANNPKLEDYDPSKPESSIIYLKANGLYSLAITQPLPVGVLKWVEPGEVN